MSNLFASSFFYYFGLAKVRRSIVPLIWEAVVERNNVISLGSRMYHLKWIVLSNYTMIEL